MKYLSLLTLVASSLVLVSCASQAPQSSPGVAQAPETSYPHRNGQLDLALSSGNYSCELGQSVQIERAYREQVNYHIQLGWKGKNYKLERDNSYSGLPRFKDRNSGLVWVDLPWKGMLLDGKSNKPLANECKSA